MKVIALIFVLSISYSLAIVGAEPATFLELPSGFVIGGYAKSNWITSGEAGKTIVPGTAFRCLFIGGDEGKLIVNKTAPEQDVCMDVWVAEFAAESFKTGIAVATTWNPQPRPVKAADATQAVYVKAVSDLLIAQGIPKPQVKITQHLRVDLDGDGEDEVLLSATRYPTADGEGNAPMAATAGSYSFVALRRLMKGKVVTQILEGEFYEKTLEFNAPNVHSVSGILDLDGDGQMEILLDSSYYEGGGTTAWKMGPTRAETVLEIACGV